MALYKPSGTVVSGDDCQERHSSKDFESEGLKSAREPSADGAKVRVACQTQCVQCHGACHAARWPSAAEPQSEKDTGKWN